MGPVSEAPTIQRLLPRQTLSLTSATPPSHSSFHPRPAPYRGVNGVPPWAIVTMVIGGLLILSMCGVLTLRLRTRWRARKGAMDSTTLAFAKGENEMNNTAGGSGDPKGSASADKGLGVVPVASGDMLAEEGTKTRRRDSLLDQAEVRIRKLIKKTRPVTSNSTSRLVHTTTNEDDRPSRGDSSTTKLRDLNPPPTALSYGETLDPNSPSNNNEGNTNLFRNFSFKSPFSGGRPQTGSSATTGPPPHPDTSPPVGPLSNRPLSSEGNAGLDYYNSAYYKSIARPSEDDWGWADDSIAHTIRGSYDNPDHEREMEDNATTIHAGTTLYHGHGGATSTEGAMSDESRSGAGGVRTLFSGRRDGGGREDDFDAIPLETRTSPPSGFWSASRTNTSRWVTR